MSHEMSSVGYAWCQRGEHVYAISWRIGDERRATRVLSRWARDPRLNLRTADAVVMAEHVYRIAREAEE